MLVLPTLLLLTLALLTPPTLSAHPPPVQTFTTSADSTGVATVYSHPVSCSFTYDTRNSRIDPPPPPPSPPSPAEQGPSLDRKMGLLAASLPTNPCLSMVDDLGYTYELCGGRTGAGRITQKGNGENNMVGLYEGPGMVENPGKTEQRRPRNGGDSPPNSVPVLQYGKGDRCFDTGLPRTAHVHFICPANLVGPYARKAAEAAGGASSGAPVLVAVAELVKCEYSFWVASDDVCGDPKFVSTPTSGVSNKLPPNAVQGGKRGGGPNGGNGNPMADASFWILSISKLPDGSHLCSIVLGLEPGAPHPAHPLTSFKLEATTKDPGSDLSLLPDAPAPSLARSLSRQNLITSGHVDLSSSSSSVSLTSSSKLEDASSSSRPTFTSASLAVITTTTTTP